MVGRLRLSLYGTRDAAQNWKKHYSGKLLGLGFRQGKASTCNFVNESKELCVTCHGDVFFITGPMRSILWLQSEMAKIYEIKSQILGPEGEKGCKQEIKHLNRIIRWGSAGIEYESDQRHADMVVQQLGLEGGKSLSTPGTPDITFAEHEDKENWEMTRCIGDLLRELIICHRIEATFNSRTRP